MEIRTRREVIAVLAGFLAGSLSGCGSPQPATGKEKEPSPAEATEFQEVARIALGPGAEVAAKGDLARNGLEQLVVINKLGRSVPESAAGGDLTAVRITRAVVIEKSAGKWAEVLRCDEHLKNPRGYLGGSPEIPVTGWLFGFSEDAQQGIEMRFTPLDAEVPEESTGNEAKVTKQPILVRWNRNVKRYQALDRIHKEFLGEIPTLEPSHSILR